MEEDIKILEEFLETAKIHTSIIPDINFEPIYKEQIQAIENLLKDYKDLHLAYELYKSKCDKLEEDNKTKLEIYELGKENARKRIEYDYIPISVIQNKLEQNKAKTDCRYCNNACDSYAVCTVLKEILEKGNK